MVAPPVTALYYAILDIWGDKWKFIIDHKSTHEFIFVLLGSATVIIVFLKGTSEYGRGLVQAKYQNILRSMLNFFNALVKRKRDRFFEKAAKLKPNQNAFRHITHPKEQINQALDGTKALLRDALLINPKNISVTIIKGDGSDIGWKYEFKCDSQMQHTSARELMLQKSTAKYCYDSGESIFISDIRKGEQEEVFVHSNRSEKSAEGSIYCKPVRVRVSNTDYIYMFTLAVYNQFLCTPYDEEECRACEMLLDEIADRVELELYLYSMKDFQDRGGNAA
jgi:hypothetical protein